MAFVNDYLTDEEIEKFRKLNISYGKKICSVSDRAVGTMNSIIMGGVICTIDRSNGMYLFYCGTDQAFGREEFWSPDFFIFIKEKKNETIVAKIGLERTHPNGFGEIYWKLYCINAQLYEKSVNYDSKNVIDDLKNALRVYKVDGDPRRIDVTGIKFDF